MPLTPGPFIASQVMATVGNNFGTVNTRVRRFVNFTVEGVDISYTDSATNGAAFTINRDGVYAIKFTDRDLAMSGITKNVTGAEATGTIDNVPLEKVLSLQGISGAAQIPVSNSVVVKLFAGDVIRAQSGGNGTAGNDKASFLIRRIQ